MSQKKGDIVILAPGAEGWELWTGAPDGPFRLAEATGVADAGGLSRLPSGDMVMLFPVRMVTWLPFRGGTGDDEMFEDLAMMHVERIGLRPDESAGQLLDTFVVEREGEETRLLSVVLRTPEEGDLPPRSPKEFDLSARALPLPENSVALWRELGRWVFAISGAGGSVVYAQATTCIGDQPDAAVAGDVQLALTQLALQGMAVDPAQVLVWTDNEAVGSAPEFDGLFRGRVRVQERPAMVLPAPRSRLLPEDVRAARRERTSQQRKTALVVLAALVYLGWVAWLGFGLWNDRSKVAELRTKAAGVAPIAEAFSSHQLQWDELTPVVDVDEWPVQLLYRCVRQIPQNQGLRLSIADMTSDESGIVQQIRLVGEAKDPGPIQKFSLALQRHRELEIFRWEVPPPQQTKKGDWSFTFTGARPDA